MAGLHGLDARLPVPPVAEGAPQDMSEEARRSSGIVRLPQSLDEALDRFEEDTDLTGTIGAGLKSAYLAHKRFEAGLMRDLTPEAQCAKYLLAY